MGSRKKKAVLGDSDSIQINGSSDMPLDPIESHTHCCSIDFDETIRQVSAIKGELGDIATHTMLNTLNQLKYIKAIKDRSELKKRVATIASQPQRVSSSSLNTSDVLDFTAVSESEKPYSKRLIRVPGSGSEPLAISSLRPHSEEDGVKKQDGLRQGSVDVMKHSADADTSEENYLFELPRRSSIAETKGESVSGGRRHSRVLSLKQIPSEVSVDPLTNYLKRNASNFRKSLGERELTTESGMLGEEEQIKERVSNDSVLTPEQRLSESEFPIDARLGEQDYLDNQKVDEVITPKVVPADEDNRLISKKSDEDLASKYSKTSDEDLASKNSKKNDEDLASKYSKKSDEDSASKYSKKSDKDLASKYSKKSDEDSSSKYSKKSDEDLASKYSKKSDEDSASKYSKKSDEDLASKYSKKSDENLAPKYVSEDEDDKLIIQKSKEDIFAKVMSMDEDKKSVNQGSDEDIVTKSVSEDDFPEVLSLGDVEDSSIQIRESDDIFTIEMSEDYLPDVASMLAEETKDDENEQEHVVPQKMSKEKINGTRISPVPSNKEEPEEKSHARKDFKIPKDDQESLQKEVILPPVSLPKEPVMKVESKGSIEEQTGSNAPAVDEKSPRKPKVRTLNTENMQNRDHYYMDISPKQTDSITQFTIDTKLGNKRVKCDFSGNVSVNIIASDEKIGETRSKKPKLKVFDLSNDEGTKIEKVKRRRVSFDDQTGKRILKGMSQVHVYVILANNYSSLLTYLLKFEENSYCRNKTECLEFDTKNQKHDSNRSPSDGAANGKNLSTSSPVILNLMNAIIYITRFLRAAEKSKSVENFIINFSEFFYQEKTLNVYQEIPRFFNCNNKHETISVAETVKFLTLFRFPEFYEKISENNKFQIMPLEQKRKPYQSFNDIDNEGNIQINLIGASSDTVTVAKKEESENGKNYNVFEIVIPHKQSFKQKRAETTTSDDESAEYRLYKKSYGEPRAVSATRDSRPSKVSDKSERRRSVLFADKTTVDDSNNVSVSNAEAQKDTAPHYQSGEPDELQQSSGTQETDIQKSDLGSNDEYPDDENVNQMSDAQPEGSRFDPNSNNYIYGADPRFASPFADQSGRPLPDWLSGVDIFESDIDSMPEFADVADAKYQVDKKITSSPKKGDMKQPISENVKPEQEKITADLHPISEKVQPENYKRDVKSQPEREKFQSGREKTDEKLQAVPNAVQPHEELAQQDRLVPSISDMDISKPRMPIKSITSEESLPRTQPEVNFPSISEKGEYIRQLDTRAEKPPSKQGKPPFDEHTINTDKHLDSHKRHDYETDALQFPEEAAHKKFNTETSIVPDSKVTNQKDGKYGEGEYSPLGSISHSYKDQPIKPDKGKYSPYDSLSPPHKEQPIKPVEGKYSPHDSLSPSSEERPIKPVEGKYSPHGSLLPSHEKQPKKPIEGKYSPRASVPPSHEEQPMKPVEGKYSPHGILPPSDKEKPMKPVEGKYSPRGSVSPSHEEQLTKPVEGKYSPHGILPPSDKEKSMKPVEGKYSPHDSLSPSYEERYLKPVTGKSSPRGSLSPSHEEQPMKPVEGKYSPHGILPPSDKEKPMKPVEGKYSPRGSVSPSHEEQLTKPVEGKYGPHGILPPSDKEKSMKPVEGKYSPHDSLSPSYEERYLKPVTGKSSPRGSLSPSHEEQPMQPVEGKYSPHGILPPSDKEKSMKPVDGKYSPRGSVSPSHEEQLMKPVEGKYSPQGILPPSDKEKSMKPVEVKYSPHDSLSPSYEERYLKPVTGKSSPRGSLSPSHEEQPMKPVEGKYSPHGILPTSDKEKPMKPVECKYSPRGSVSPSHEEQPMKPVEGKYSPHGILPPSDKEKSMKPIDGKYSPRGSVSPSHEEQLMKPVEGKYSPQGILPPSDKENSMKPVEGKYSPHDSLSPSYEERYLKSVTGKSSPRGSLSPPHEEQPMKSIDSLSPPHKEQPINPVERKYSPHSSLSPLHEGKPMKPDEGKYSPRGSLSPSHEEQPMKPVEGKYSPRGSLSHSYEERLMEPVAGKYNPHDSLSPSQEERPMEHLAGKYSPRGSLSPSHEEQPMKPVEGKYSPHDSLPPSDKEQPTKPVDSLSPPHKEQPMKPVEGKYSPHSNLSPLHEGKPMKPVEGKYSPRGSLSPSHEEQPMKPVEGKYSPRGSLSHSYEERLMEPVAGKYSPHGIHLPSHEEQPMKPVTGKYSPHDSLSPSLEGQPMKPVEGKYSSLLSPRDKQPSKAVEGEYSPHGSISPFVEPKQPTPSSAEKQPISESSYKPEAKIPKIYQRPEERLLDNVDSETSQIFETPDNYDDKYTADKYSSLKAYWPHDKRPVRLSPEERQDTKAMTQKGSDTIRPKYSAGDPVLVKSKTPEETGDTKLKPVHEDIIDKKTYTPYREGIKYGRNLNHDSLDSEGKDSSANKTNGEKEDEYSPSKRSWLPPGEYVTPVEEPPFVKTSKEDDSQTRRVKFSDGTHPIRDDTRSILKPPDKPDEADAFVGSTNTTEDFKNDRPKDRQREQFMVYAGHVGESSPFLHKSEFDGSPVEPDDDHRSSESESSSVRRFNNMTAVDSKVKGPISDNIFPYKNEHLVYAGEIEERSPFSYDEYMLERESNSPKLQQNASYSQQRDPRYEQQRGPSYSQRDPNSRQRDPSYSQQRDPSYSQQQDPSYAQQRDPSYSQKRDPSYSQQQDSRYSQQDPSYSQQRDPSYAQQQDPRYLQKRDPSYSQQDSRYSQQDPSYSQQRDPSYAQQQYTSYSQQRDPSYSQQRDPRYGQQKDLQVSSQLKKSDAGGTQKVSFEESPETEISKYEVTLPQKQKRGDDQVETEGRAVIIFVKAKHIVPKEDGKINVADSSQNELNLESERDKRKDGFKSDKNNMETMTEGDYDPDLIDDDETTFFTQGTQIPTRGLLDSTRSSRTPSETLRKGEHPSDSSRSRKDSKLKSSQEDETAFYTEGIQTVLKGEDIIITKLSDEDKIREEEVTDGTAYQSEYGLPDVTRRIESIVSQQSKKNDTRVSFSPTEEPEGTKRPTYSSDSSKSRKDTKVKSLPDDKTAFYNEGTQTILKGGDIITTPEVDVTNGTAYQSEYGSSDVTRRIDSIVSQQSKKNDTRVSFSPSEEQKKEKRPTYDSSERRKDRKIKALTGEEDESRWTADKSKRRVEISKLPEFEVVASAAISKLPMKDQPIQPKFYKRDLAYSMNVQSDSFNGTCNFYLDPKLRKVIRNVLIACADKKK